MSTQAQRAILGYQVNGLPIREVAAGAVTTRAVVLCTSCRATIRMQGGPLPGARCAACYEAEGPTPEELARVAALTAAAEHALEAELRVLQGQLGPRWALVDVETECPAAPQGWRAVLTVVPRAG